MTEVGGDTPGGGGLNPPNEPAPEDDTEPDNGDDED